MVRCKGKPQRQGHNREAQKNPWLWFFCPGGCVCCLWSVCMARRETVGCREPVECARFPVWAFERRWLTVNAVCESCGKVILNARNRQRFCSDCTKKRQKAASLKYYENNRDEINERLRLRTQMHRMPDPEPVPPPRTPPKYTIAQVDAKAKELGISYGKCNLLLEQGKITI